MADGVRTLIEGSVGVCRIESPASRNALSLELLGAVVSGLEALGDDAAARCLVLAGTDDVFATGADAATLAGAGPEPASAAELWSRLGAVGKPIVAGVSGWALANRAILAAENEPLREGLETERALLAKAMATEDRAEGVQAFLEGRPPRFSGR